MLVLPKALMKSEKENLYNLSQVALLGFAVKRNQVLKPQYVKKKTLCRRSHIRKLKSSGNISSCRSNKLGE